MEPIVVPRSQHTLSRRDIDQDALKVLYRLRDASFLAYLVGGSVRDLLLGRQPKDFDIGTSAHPYQVKRLFRNCWIIGRRFRLAHVKFGTKVIEVATFRRQVPPGAEADGTPGELAAPGAPAPPAPDLFIHRDNSFGTPEQDAFRRDFTVNALFYDIATFSIIDYVGGLEDLHRRVVRAIGDPDERFREDPVRMLRAVALSARLDFIIDPPAYDAIRRHRRELARSAPARLVEEYYKILRTGAAEQAFRALADVGLLDPVAPELQRGASDALWRSLGALDRYRTRFDGRAEGVTNAILLGSLIVPLGFPGLTAADARRVLPRAALGLLPLARRDVERLTQILALQRRLTDPTVSPRAARALAHRSAFGEALTWLDLHGPSPNLADRWRELVEPIGDEQPPDFAPPDERRRRRRRRRYRRPVPQQ
jgi:poly(A) polymerase